MGKLHSAVSPEEGFGTKSCSTKAWGMMFVAAAIMLSLAMPAFAQPQNAGEGGQRRGKQARLRERIEERKMQKLIEVLELDEQTVQKLTPVVQDYNQRQRQLGAKRADLLRQLRANLATETPDASALRGAIEEYKKINLELAQNRTLELDEISKVLTDEQVAKLLLFLPKFERRVKQMMCDVHARRRQRDGAAQGSQKPLECPLGNEPMQGRQNQIPPGPPNAAEGQ